jgi:hypothetical protein
MTESFRLTSQIRIGHSSRKYGGEREVSQKSRESTSPASTHEGEIPARISLTRYLKMIFRNDKKDNNLPAQVVPLLPLRGLVIFPHEVFPISVGRHKSIKALE